MSTDDISLSRKKESQKLLAQKPFYIRLKVCIIKKNPWMNQTSLILLVEKRREKITEVKKHYRRNLVERIFFLG